MKKDESEPQASPKHIETFFMMTVSYVATAYDGDKQNKGAV